MDAYLPQDRRHTLINGMSIPERCHGAALFADLSGFTPLTEGLTQALSPRKAAERLAQQITRLYDTLTALVDRWHGSVVGFAGDAIMAWFDDQHGEAAERAIACALAMQQSMPDVSVLTLPNGVSHSLALKVSIACGPARRLVVGNAHIQQFDILAGATLHEVAAIEHLARPNEVLISETVAARLGLDLASLSWLSDSEGVRGTLITSLDTTPTPDPWSAGVGETLQPELLQPWILPAIYERYQQGLSDFLSELRPAVPMFIRFASLNYDDDEAAGTYLNEFICAAQQIINRYGGTLLQITIGDKGSSVYAVFGAPISHENDASRAVLAALELHQLAGRQLVIAPLQIGIAQGILLVGAYGTEPSRTYAAMGDAVNVAARLMMAAGPGETLVTDRIHGLVANVVELEVRVPLRLKGKAQAQPVSAVLAPRVRRGIQLEEPHYQLPMIGRRAEREQIGQILNEVATGRGQIVGISGEAGQGKSRLVAEAIRMAHMQGYTSYGGACLSIGKHMPYVVWESIWQSFFEVLPDSADRELAERLRKQLELLVPNRVESLPLLGSLLGVALPDNQFTQGLEPQDRQHALHALLRDCLVAAARAELFPQQKILLVLEDIHWIDELSYLLLMDVVRVISDLPVLIIVAYRSNPEYQIDLQRLFDLPYWRSISIDGLNHEDAADFIKMKLEQPDKNASMEFVDDFIQKLLIRTQSNPFYLEELLNYLHDQGVDLHDPAALSSVELPDSLQRLVLSRLDRLSLKQQALVKSASVIGRRFLIVWLQGAFGTMNYTDNLTSELTNIRRVDLIDIDIQEPELAYVFKHIITRDVAYSSLSDATRSMLHEQIAVYLEHLVPHDGYLDLIAYHYDHSNNLAQRRRYLRLAGEAAMARYANESAISYFLRALHLVPQDDMEERYELMMALDTLYECIGDIKVRENNINTLIDLYGSSSNSLYRVSVLLRQSDFLHSVYGAHRSMVPAKEAYDLAVSEHMTDMIAMAFIRYTWSVINISSEDVSEMHLNRAVDLAVRSGNRRIEFLARYMQMMWFLLACRYIECLDTGNKALMICSELNLYRYEAFILQISCLALFDVADFDRALEYLEKSTKLYYLVDDRHHIGMNIAQKALFLCLMGDFTQAYDYADQVKQWFASMEINIVATDYLWSLALFFDQVGDYVQARDLIEQALEWSSRFPVPLYKGKHLGVFALVQLHMGAADLALEHAQQAVALLSPVLIGSKYVFALTVKAHALAQLEQWEAAERSYIEAYNLRKKFQEYHLLNEPLAGMARSAFALHRHEEALAHVNAILSYLEHHHLDGMIDLFWVYLTCYEVLAGVGDDRADTVLQTAYDRLQSRARSIPDIVKKQRFLEEIAVHHRIISLWERDAGYSQDYV